MAIIDKPAKRRLRRKWRSRRQSAVEFGQQADEQIERLLIRRFERLGSVKRFVGLWLLLIILLVSVTIFQLRALPAYYQQLRPAPGGILNEGLVGTFTNANPIYATSVADTAVSRLIFDGLFKYDNQNRLVPDLATGWKLGTDHRTYTVSLRHDVLWQDGMPFTADDVVYTYRTIQDPASQSPLQSSWAGVQIKKINNYTVSFNLPSDLVSFPYSLTNGIAPAHLLSDISDSQLRSDTFNTNPVGTGPFQWKFVDVNDQGSPTRQQKIGFGAYQGYFAGRPKLDGFSITTYTDEKYLITAFQNKQINAMSGLESLPAQLAKESSIQVNLTPSTSMVMAFFNNSVPALNNTKIRQAMVAAVDRQPLTDLSSFATNLVNEPLLSDQLGYSPKFMQLNYNFKKAKQLLQSSGIGKRTIHLEMRTQNTPDYTSAAQLLQTAWQKLGITVDVHYYSNDDLQSEIIANHDYDILLYGINVGVDPDVFAYWDSSQASLSSEDHLNLSEYKSTIASQALEAGRTRADVATRVIKYQAFLNQWRQDAPALALYQPNFLYITRGAIYNFDRHADNSAADRFYNVAGWEIRQTRQTVK